MQKFSLGVDFGGLVALETEDANWLQHQAAEDISIEDGAARADQRVEYRLGGQGQPVRVSHAHDFEL